MTLENNWAYGGGIDYWIEGIGCAGGPVYGWEGFCFTDVGGSLRCYYENGEEVYNPYDQECFVEIRPERTTFLKNGITKQ